MPAAGKQQKQFKLETVRAADVQAPFVPSLRGRGGVYQNKVSELIASPAMALRILSGDPSTLIQVRKAAEELRVKLLYARDGQYVYIRVFRLSEKQIEILGILLNGPATVNTLRPQIKDCNLPPELQSLAETELIQLGRDSRWTITDAGSAELVKAKPSGAAEA